jgi:hypothetical protein
MHSNYCPIRLTPLWIVYNQNMKRTALARKTPLKAKTGISSRKAVKKSATGHQKPKKRKVKRPITKLQGKLWEECKRITRLRYQLHDGTYKCYTCDAHLEVPAKAHTGHFIPSSVCSTEMRYDLGNLRVQCYRCNINLSGNWIEYEKRLNQEMGAGYTEKLKARNESTKGLMYREEWYEMYIKNYKEII